MERMVVKLRLVEFRVVTRPSKVLPVRRIPMPRQITRLRIQRRLAIATARQQAKAAERR